MQTTQANLEASDGLGLYAEKNTPDGALSGETLVFSCAYCTTHENWRSQVEPFVAAGHEVVLWDLRGHGRSEAPQDPDRYSMDQVVADLHAVLEWATPGGAVVLAGLSFGGLASLHYTLAHPYRVRALVLSGSGPGFKNPEAAEQWRIRSERTASFLEERGFEAFVTGKAAPTCIGLHPERPAAQRAAAAITTQNPAAVGHFGRRVAGLAPSVIDELAQIEQPALGLVGEHDEASVRAGQVMAGKLPNATHTVIPGAGHISNIDETEAWNRTVLDFLADLPLA